MKNLPWPLGLEKRPVPLPSLRELKHHKSGRRAFAATLTVNAIYSSDISISDFIVASPVAKITTKQSREQGKEETDKDQKETGSGGTIQGGRQTESPRSPFALNWSPPRPYRGRNYQWLIREHGTGSGEESRRQEQQRWGEAPGMSYDSPEWTSSLTAQLGTSKAC